MKREIIIQCNSNGEIAISGIEYDEGINVVLVDEKNAPIARYEFKKSQLLNKKKIQYYSGNARIEFVGVVPSMKYELCGIKQS